MLIKNFNITSCKHDLHSCYIYTCVEQTNVYIYRVNICILIHYVDIFDIYIVKIDVHK